MRIGVATKNEYLWQKLRLTLGGDAECVRLDEYSGDGADLCLWDCDTLGDSKIEGAVTLGHGGCDLTLPLSFDTILSLLTREEEQPPLVLKDRCAILRGERIPLTDVELALFGILYSAGGEFVSREELLSQVWGDVTDGVLNVYIHYLREKLERGEKIIISSRKFGYKIDERFIRSGACHEKPDKVNEQSEE